MKLEFSYTPRGFEFVQFTDRYGARCSLQKSSLAEEAAIWLGVETNQQGAPLDGGRMHLTQEMAADLLPFLRRFVEEGRLWTPEWYEEGMQAAQETGSGREP